MPVRDKTGPQGLGPKTGRGLGSCKEVEEAVGDTINSQRLGLGRGRGLGTGRRLESYKNIKENATDTTPEKILKKIMGKD